MYLWARDYWGRLGGLISAIAYLYAPYHILDYFVRGDLHETAALAFFPLALFSFNRYFATGKKKYILLNVVSYSLIALSHTLMSMLFTPLLFFYILLLKYQHKPSSRKTPKALFHVFLGIICTSFYWLPGFFERRFVKLDTMTQGFGNFRDHFIRLHQLFNPQWGYGASVKGVEDTISFQIGNAAILLSLIGILSIPFSRRRNAGGKNVIFIFVIAAFFISVFFMLDISAELWETIPFLAYFQFPYRFLAPASLLISFCAGSSIRLFHNSKPITRSLFTAIAVFVLLILNVGYCRVVGYVETPESQWNYETLRKFRDSIQTGEYIPRWVKGFPPPKNFNFVLEKIPENGFSRESMNKRLKSRVEKFKHLELYEKKEIPVGSRIIRPQKYNILKGNPLISKYHFSSGEISFLYSSQISSEILLGSFFYPGWMLYLDEKAVSQPQPDPNSGLTLLKLPPGVFKVKILFQETPLRIASWILSSLTFLALCIYLIASYLFQNEEDTQKSDQFMP